MIAYIGRCAMCYGTVILTWALLAPSGQIWQAFLGGLLISAGADLGGRHA